MPQNFSNYVYCHCEFQSDNSLLNSLVQTAGQDWQDDKLKQLTTRLQQKQQDYNNCLLYLNMDASIESRSCSELSVGWWWYSGSTTLTSLTFPDLRNQYKGRCLSSSVEMNLFCMLVGFAILAHRCTVMMLHCTMKWLLDFNTFVVWWS